MFVSPCKVPRNPASAQAIGLALHELATNAAKYGALSTDTGRADVSWGIDGDTLTISWTEREGPPVSAPKRRGFGTSREASPRPACLDYAAKVRDEGQGHGYPRLPAHSELLRRNAEERLVRPKLLLSTGCVSNFTL